MIDAAPALVLEHIHKRFGSVRALTDATLAVRRGTVHALLGENGAGKTTLLKIAYGMESPDSGTVRVRGSAVQLRSPADAIRQGIGMVHQHFTLVPAMTVAENVTLGHHGLFDAKRAATNTMRIARETGLAIDPSASVADLPVTAQQRVELIKLLARQAEVLVLDEPTAVLAPAEADTLLRQLRQLADGGRAVVLITHRLREALSVADDVTVLRHGATTLSQPRESVSADQLVDAMLGQREAEPSVLAPNASPGAPTITANAISLVDAHGATRISNATFEIRAGELVGVAAVEGAGHRELLSAIAGRLPVHKGQLTLPSTIGFVPDDRQRDGLVLDMSLSENFALRAAGSRRGIIRWTDMRASTRDLMVAFDVRAESEQTLARKLSGGNQQKFILGRELSANPAVLVAENPTRGLDVRASAYVRARLLEAAAGGVTVVVHSSDLEEVLSVASRMLVVYAGTVRELPVDIERVGRAMLGAE